MDEQMIIEMVSEILKLFKSKYPEATDIERITAFRSAADMINQIVLIKSFSMTIASHLNKITE
jgi:NAD(P)H-hydrate repair Nnr-like enzyme with NAD(P)H-hydrate dehydratase domain